MKWIIYQIAQSTVGEEDILITKKVGYSEANLAIAEAEAYDGYTIEDDGKAFSTTTEFPGDADMTGHKIKNLGEPTDDSDATTLGKTKELLLPVKNDIAINITTLGTQCKNIFDIIAYQNLLGTATRGTSEIVENGVKISGNGTDGDAYTNPYLNHQNAYKIPVEPNKIYVMSWVADSNEAGFVYVFRNGLSNGAIGKNNNTTKDFKFTTNSDTTFITVRFGVADKDKSITYTNIMIRPADITDNTYEPYVPTVNERLTVNEKSTIINQSTIGFQSKNILKNYTEATVREHEGITYTINADGTIIANGTTGSNPSYCSLGGYFEIAETNDFILNGCATGGGDKNWALQLYKQATPNDAVLFNDYGGGYSGKIEKGIYRGLIVIRANRTATNLTFKPMLRLKGTDDTYVPYVPTVNERLVEVDNNKLNLAYFIAQNTTTTAGWYEVAKCDVIPSGGGIVRDITLCIQLTNANNTVGAKWAILNVATVISKNSTTQSTIDTMVVSFIVNKGFNTSEDNPDIIVVGTTDGATVKLAIWCKLQVQHAYCRGIPLIDAARVSVKQFNTPNYWQLLNTTTKYDSYPTDWQREIIPTDYYGGQLKSLSDRITALEEAYANLAIAAQEGANSV